MSDPTISNTPEAEPPYRQVLPVEGGFRAELPFELPLKPSAEDRYFLGQHGEASYYLTPDGDSFHIMRFIQGEFDGRGTEINFANSNPILAGGENLKVSVGLSQLEEAPAGKQVIAIEGAERFSLAPMVEACARIFNDLDESSGSLDGQDITAVNVQEHPEVQRFRDASTFGFPGSSRD